MFVHVIFLTETSSQPQMEVLVGHCLSLHWECPLKGHVLKAGSSVCGAMRKAWNPEEVGSRGSLRSLKMHHQRNNRTLISSHFYFQP